MFVKIIKLFMMIEYVLIFCTHGLQIKQLLQCLTDSFDILWYTIIFLCKLNILENSCFCDYGQDVLAIIRKQRFSKTFVFQSKIVYHKKFHKKTCSCVNWKSQNFFLIIQFFDRLLQMVS